ncbi:MAG: gliding motility lipoprotein GldD [Bacteroidetes bacterium]|nr:gliding motility lipoprotein GldD [Bacteroidota bacterium]
MHKILNLRYLIGITTTIFLFSCGGDNYVPKPRAYPRIYLPEKKYYVFDTSFCPYTFEIPEYSKMEKDTNTGYTPELTWFNLNFKPFGATLHITHYNFTSWAFYDSLVSDSRKLVNKHLLKANDILEEPISSVNPNLHGVIFRIEGNTATNYNFYVTDSVRNFFRGALYFNRITNQDSIAPVYQFIKTDVEHLIKTFKWK